jgi:hypothetical protein
MSSKLLLPILSICLFSVNGRADSRDYFRVARLSFLEGKVSFQHSDDVDWSAASINMALQPGDRLYTGDGGRAEVQFDDGSVMRLAEWTDLEILTMQEQLIQVRILIGLCSVTSRSSLNFEVDTPAAAFTTMDKGSYRFEVAENGDSDGIVRRGELDAANNDFSRRLESGQALHVPAAENGQEVQSRSGQRDAWDEWNDRRNADLQAYTSAGYLPDEIYYGASELDRYGRWVDVDGYGHGWIPYVNVGWNPYWDGRWYYRPYWGWTWVSYEPWGWLPYHYGRWYHHVSFGWCWLPGPSFSFHFWSPGLVRFYHGPDWVSWCPLGPGDYYNVNNYFYDSTYVYYLNNMRLLQRRGPDDLLNRANPGAMRAVRTEQFVNGSAGARPEPLRQDPVMGRNGKIVTGQLDIEPTARSYAPVPDRPAVRPATAEARSVVVRSEPEYRSPNVRVQRITNPQIPVPRTRGEAAGLATAPESRGRIGGTGNVPDRIGAPARIYQVPRSSVDTSNPPAAGRQPQIGTTPPADMPARKMESRPPREATPVAPRVQRSEPPMPVSRPPAEQRTLAPATRQNAGPPPAAARPQNPPGAGKPPDSQVIKKMERESQTFSS